MPSREQVTLKGELRRGRMGEGEGKSGVSKSSPSRDETPRSHRIAQRERFSNGAFWNGATGHFGTKGNVFLMNLALCAVNAVDHQWQDSGYVRKDEADSKHI